MFYFDKTDSRVLFGDIRERETAVFTNGQTFKVEPDVVMNFRNLPYDDETFSAVIFDPPHIIQDMKTGWLVTKYGSLSFSTWQDEIREGFAECFRVLKPGGILIFKWAESSVTVKEILTLTPEKPVCGHPSGKRMGTHWIMFMKNL